MRIAIISDIHDNIPKLRSALGAMDGVEVLICCGDLCSPFIVKELGQGFTGPIHIVFGNNDGDRFRIYQCAERFDHMTIHGEFATLDIDGRSFAINHFDNIGRTMTGRFDVVCFGHNHQHEIRSEGKTLIVNPGEIYGLLTGDSTFAVYDTGSGEAIRVDVP